MATRTKSKPKSKNPVSRKPRAKKPEAAHQEGATSLAIDHAKEEDHEFRVQCERMEAEIRQAERVVKDAKAEHKEAKEELEAKIKTLRNFIRSYNEELPLFDKNGSLKGTENGEKVLEVSPTDDSWRAEKIEEVLDLTKHIVSLLHAVNIHTIGDLADWTNPAKHGGKQNNIGDIKGIGAKAAEKIEEAMTAFWAKRQEAEQQQLAEAAALDNPEPGETTATDEDKCRHCAAPLELPAVAVHCPECQRAGCQHCMPAGGEKPCPQCEASE